MYKVFTNDKVLYLTDDLNKYATDKRHLYMTYDGEENLRRLLLIMEKDRRHNFKEAFICHADIKELWGAFLRIHQVVNAAGGMVKNKEGAILFIKRPDYSDQWDLPKGKMDEGEQPEQTAIREVAEECQIAPTQVIRKLNVTYHTYLQGEERLLKKTEWFELSYEGDKEPVPQQEEGITEARWVKKDAIHITVDKAYPSVKYLMIESGMIPAGQ